MFKLNTFLILRNKLHSFRTLWKHFYKSYGQMSDESGRSNLRYFPNPFEDFDPAKVQAKDLLDVNGSKLSTWWDGKVQECIKKLFVKFEYGLKHEVDLSDCSVYTGSAGIALLFFRMYDKFDRRQDNRYLNRALEWIKPCVDHLRSKRVCDEISFLCGDAGALAIGAVIYHCLDDEEESQLWCIKKLLAMSDTVISDPEIPDEILYGRSGYLYALTFVRHYIGNDVVSQEVIDKVVDAIKTSGETLSSHKRSRCPLLYKWHHSYYLGAAHGISGIYFLLMRLDKFHEREDLKHKVKQGVDFLMTQRFASGNYPSSLEKERDELVHWCHGAPGFIHMFIQAYRVFGDDIYLQEARSCADVLWKRSLLKKGYGLCHGPAGNAYGFLALYQMTKELKYLYRALKFAEWIFNYGSHGCRVADRPYSLFEGMAGTLYYLVDILHPNEAEFPAFYY